jgi:hypothetical protein
VFADGTGYHAASFDIVVIAYREVTLCCKLFLRPGQYNVHDAADHVFAIECALGTTQSLNALDVAELERLGCTVCSRRVAVTIISSSRPASPLLWAISGNQLSKSAPRVIETAAGRK